MTLSTTTIKDLYAGDDSTVSFDTTFIFWDSTDLTVIHRASDGTETTWTEGSEYSVTGGNGAVGTVVVSTSPIDYTPATGEKLLIKSDRDDIQEGDFPLSGPFPSTVAEQSLDQAVRLVQQISEEISRSILLPATTSLSGLGIPEPGAGELIRYNVAGTNLETVAVADLSLSIDAIITGVADTDMLYWDNGQSAWVNFTPGVAGLAVLQLATDNAVRDYIVGIDEITLAQWGHVHS